MPEFLSFLFEESKAIQIRNKYTRNPDDSRCPGIQHVLGYQDSLLPMSSVWLMNELACLGYHLEWNYARKYVLENYFHRIAIVHLFFLHEKIYKLGLSQSS